MKNDNTQKSLSSNQNTEVTFSDELEELEKNQKEIGEAIARQLEKDRVEIKYNPSDYIGKKKRKKKEIDLNSIGDIL